MYKLYTLDNQYIKEVNEVPIGFTGIVRTANNSEFWYKNGNWHRENGPALNYTSTGRKFYYIDGNLITKEQHDLYVDIMKLKGLYK